MAQVTEHRRQWKRDYGPRWRKRRSATHYIIRCEVDLAFLADITAYQLSLHTTRSEAIRTLIEVGLEEVNKK